MENLPVRHRAARSPGPIVAVDVGSTMALRAEVQERGIRGDVHPRPRDRDADEVQTRLEGWAGPPLVLVHPRVEHVSMFAFDRNRELIEEGVAGHRDHARLDLRR